MWGRGPSGPDGRTTDCVPQPLHPLRRRQVVVFSFSTCPFCVKAKALLSGLGADFEALELNQMGAEGLQLRAELAEARRGGAGGGRAEAGGC